MTTQNPGKPAPYPLAELHCHLEGTLQPQLLRRLAGAIPRGLVDDTGRYRWSDFATFLEAYDAVAAAINSPEKYHAVTYDYLTRVAAAGGIYVEVTASPDHAREQGLAYVDMVSGIASAIDAARDACGIEARIIITALRHTGPAAAETVAEAAHRNPHSYVTGFGLAGDERLYHPRDFRRAFDIAGAAGLGLTAHAGEICGAESVRETIAALPVTRIGHGVRAIDDAESVRLLIERNIILEVCPHSNLSLSLFPDATSHPLADLRAAGVRVTLNSDDPPFFGAELIDNYRFAEEYAGFTRSDLIAVTENAIDAAFVDDATRSTLRNRITSWPSA